MSLISCATCAHSFLVAIGFFNGSGRITHTFLSISCMTSGVISLPSPVKEHVAITYSTLFLLISMFYHLPPRCRNISPPSMSVTPIIIGTFVNFPSPSSFLGCSVRNGSCASEFSMTGVKGMALTSGLFKSLEGKKIMKSQNNDLWLTSHLLRWK